MCICICTYKHDVEAELEALFCEPLDVTDTPTVGARARGRVVSDIYISYYV